MPCIVHWKFTFNHTFLSNNFLSQSHNIISLCTVNNKNFTFEKIFIILVGSNRCSKYIFYYYYKFSLTLKLSVLMLTVQYIADTILFIRWKTFSLSFSLQFILTFYKTGRLFLQCELCLNHFKYFETKIIPVSLYFYQHGINNKWRVTFLLYIYRSIREWLIWIR